VFAERLLREAGVPPVVRKVAEARNERRYGVRSILYTKGACEPQRRWTLSLGTAGVRMKVADRGHNLIEDCLEAACSLALCQGANDSANQTEGRLTRISCPPRFVALAAPLWMRPAWPSVSGS
jgi:hypothetical protein